MSEPTNEAENVLTCSDKLGGGKDGKMDELPPVNSLATNFDDKLLCCCRRQRSSTACTNRSKRARPMRVCQVLWLVSLPSLSLRQKELEYVRVMAILRMLTDLKFHGRAWQSWASQPTNNGQSSLALQAAFLAELTTWKRLNSHRIAAPLCM